MYARKTVKSKSVRQRKCHFRILSFFGQPKYLNNALNTYCGCSTKTIHTSVQSAPDPFYNCSTADGQTTAQWVLRHKPATLSWISTGVLRHSNYILVTRLGTTLSLHFCHFGTSNLVKKKIRPAPRWRMMRNAIDTA